MKSQFEEVRRTGLWSRLLVLGKFIVYCIAGILGVIVLFFLALYFYENRDPGYNKLTQSEVTHYANTLDKHGKPPIDYVVGKFHRHPVVILGEPHRVREHYEFLIRLLAPLQEAGVYHIGIEFFLISDQERIDRLLLSKDFDTQLAREIVLAPNILFYYQELFDLLEATWTLNQSGQQIRIIGCGEYDVERKRRRGDALFAEVIYEIVENGHKVLVYCGTHHAFTGYTQPNLNPWVKPTRRSRMGNLLQDRFKVNPFFIQLHYPVLKRFWLFVPILLYRQGYCLPFAGSLDQIFQAYDTPVGFDTDLQEFGSFADSFSYYAMGHGSIGLRDFSDGYVYLNPLDAYHFVTPLKDIAATEKERAFIRSSIRQDLHYLFETNEKATLLLQRDGISQEEMLNMLDLRGLEDLF